MSVAPAKDLSVTVSWDGLWRQTTRDAVYTEPFVAVPRTPSNGSRFTGHQVSLDVDWILERHVEFKTSYVHFMVGDGLRAAGGRNVDFVMASIAYKF